MKKKTTAIVAILIIAAIGIPAAANIYDAYYGQNVYREKIEIRIVENIKVEPLELLSGMDLYPGDIFCKRYKITNKGRIKQKMRVNFEIKVPGEAFAVIEGKGGVAEHEFYVLPGEQIVQACWKPFTNTASGDYDNTYIVFSRMRDI